MTNHRPYRDILTGKTNKQDPGLRHAIAGIIVAALIWAALMCLCIF